MFVECEAQSIAHNMYEALLKIKKVVTFHVNYSDRFNIRCETIYSDFLVDRMNSLFLSKIW